ncbi:hypothetical protein OHT61_26390 [Streptomyces sp. NBC_00178]|uniref:hypothetical protein n=1 Tax=Streptomyces sp. NBC_00178 TaxID=2975672 RepID=UPI002E2E088A|nr:hypothetical protein [Streptomyces sp. NBC_00178]
MSTATENAGHLAQPRGARRGVREHTAHGLARRAIGPRPTGISVDPENLDINKPLNFHHEETNIH